MMLQVSVNDENNAVNIPFGSLSISYHSKTNGIQKIARMKRGVKENHFIAEFDENNVDFQIEIQNLSDDRFIRFDLEGIGKIFPFATIANSSWKIEKLKSVGILHFSTANRLKRILVNVEYSKPPYYSIYVNIGKSKRETLEVNRLLTVAELKEAIKEKYDIDCVYQNVHFEGKQLDDGSTMEMLGIKEYSTVDLRGVVIPVTVKILPNKPVTIEFNTLDTVADLKIKIEEKEGIPVNEQHLYLRENETFDDALLPTFYITGKHLFLASKWKTDHKNNLPCLKKTPHECSPLSSFRVNVSHYGTVFSVDVCSFETVEELMSKIQEKKPGDDQTCFLFHFGKRLQNDLTLEIYNIKEGSDLQLHVPCTKDHHVCIGQQIFIKSLSRKVISIPFCGLETIEAVKGKVNDKDGIPIDQQRLIFRGAQLQNELTLNDYGICPDETIHFVLKLSAGCGCECGCSSSLKCKRYIVWKNWKAALTNFSELPSHNYCLDQSIQIKPFAVELRLATVPRLSKCMFAPSC